MPYKNKKNLNISQLYTGAEYISIKTRTKGGEAVDKKISLVMDEEVLKKVDEKAKESLRTRSKYIEFVLREKLKEKENANTK